jgi:hypothetical protein
MRPSHALPVPRRSAQAAPNPPPPTDEPAASGAAAAGAAPAASGDADFEKLAEQDLQEEVIVVRMSQQF